MAAVARYELLRPHELEEVVKRAPVAYIPLGSLEWHGRHLPLGNDAIKAYEICLRAAEKTGGAVFPPLYWGVECLKLRGAGVRDGTVDVDYWSYRSFLLDVVRRVVKQGFRVVVLLTGHYSREQVAVVKKVAEECEKMTGRVKPKGTSPIRVLALPEYELATDIGYRGDHAAMWETSILLYLRPELVDMSRLTDMLGVDGEDPRTRASRELGRRVVELIVRRLCELVMAALAELEAGELGGE